MTVTARTTCRSCSSALAPILSLGPTYLSDFPRSAGTRTHPPVPLDLMRCTSPACGLVQLAHTTPPDWMFKTYWYRSGVNESMIAELQDLVAQATARVVLPHHAVVVDIGANDGTLLRNYPQGLTTVAWEPALNLYETLRPHANVLYPEYFHVEQDWGLESKARIISCVACFYDLDDPHRFLDGITRILHSEGVFVVQQAYLLAMLQHTAFDNICHEHLAYHDLRSMEALLAPHHLRVVDAEERAINGGSFRLTIALTSGAWRPCAAVEAMRAKEAAFYADRPKVFEAFAHRVEHVKAQLQAVLGMYGLKGGAVDLYAASTKFNTLAEYVGIDARSIRQAWERSPEKVGRYLGVSAIPIVSEEAGRADPPAALLLGAWSFKEAFLAREHAYLEAGGHVVVPLPKVEVVMRKR